MTTVYLVIVGRGSVYDDVADEAGALVLAEELSEQLGKQADHLTSIGVEAEAQPVYVVPVEALAVFQRGRRADRPPLPAPASASSEAGK